MRSVSPLISIGLPAFNCEETLAAAIRSIVNQRYKHWELLLIDDGSTDGTVGIARTFGDPRIHISEDGEHKGLVHRLNQAVGLARGQYFARMDADDVAYPDRLEQQVEFLRQHSEIDLLACGMIVFQSGGAAIGCRSGPQAHEEICSRPLQGFPLGHPTWIGRTEWFREHPYDPAAIRAEDQVLLLTSYSTSRFANLPYVLHGYREDRLSLGKTLRARRSFARAIRSSRLPRESAWSRRIAVIQQFLKSLVDVMASVSGLGYALLPHRARPVQPADLRRWKDVWSQLNQQTNP